ncbi:hypothetical protein OG625_09845 [Streptomyces sp. NBC_01351]|uniref:hypothetical protein n=1 Tax=Streptomyces sp. NBC_01351 TaxID=2903833 RepID=UPI002E36D858|nr:hypothetical protein [Streptomyces sp. NBC_01351]
MVDGFATAGPRHVRARRARRQEQGLMAAVNRVRADDPHLVAGTVLETVALHREPDGTLLDPHTAAVELLNIIRPTVAVTWYVTFAAHALHRHPGRPDQLKTDGSARARAFAHEVRRFYPFVPFIAGLAAHDITLSLLAPLSSALARTDPAVPHQHLSIPLSRIPTRPRSGFVIEVASRARRHDAPRFPSQRERARQGDPRGSGSGAVVYCPAPVELRRDPAGRACRRTAVTGGDRHGQCRVRGAREFAASVRAQDQSRSAA